MEPRYQFNDKGSEAEKLKETYESSPEEKAESEKRHTSLTKIPFHEWLKEKVPDWAEDDDAFTCSNNK